MCHENLWTILVDLSLKASKCDPVEGFTVWKQQRCVVCVSIRACYMYKIRDTSTHDIRWKRDDDEASEGWQYSWLARLSQVFPGTTDFCWFQRNRGQWNSINIHQRSRKSSSRVWICSENFFCGLKKEKLNEKSLRIFEYLQIEILTQKLFNYFYHHSKWLERKNSK